MARKKEPSDILLRCYPAGAQLPRPVREPEPVHMPESLLIIDTETAAEATRTMPGFEEPAWGAMQQSLLFGRCQVWKRAEDTAKMRIAGQTPGHYYPAVEYLFYPDELPAEGVRRIQRYVETHSKPLGDHREYSTACTVDGCDCWPALYVLPLSEFLAVFYKLACEANRKGYRRRGRKQTRLHSLVVGFNLPFDLSRLAWRAAPARGDFENGFSFTLWTYTDKATGEKRADTFKPHLCIRHIGRDENLYKWAGHRVRTRGGLSINISYPANFLDIQTLARALTGVGWGLDSLALNLCDERKSKISGHGLLTDEYLDYNRQDLRLTGMCANALFDRWQMYFPDGNGKPPWRFYSPASVAKAYLQIMGVQPRLAAQPDFPPHVLGYAMAAYYGGRVECKIRKCAVPVLYLDVTSMYPSVNALMGLWSFITAASVQVDEGPDVTADVQALLDTISLADCFDPDRWPGFTALAAVLPAGDILPARVNYEGGERIGVNPVYSDTPLWYGLPDLIASKLLTGRAPKVVRALRLQAVNRQETLQPCKLAGGVPVNPRTDDFFRLLIEERQRIKKGMGEHAALDDFERDQLQNAFKFIANSGSYGIFAEMVREDLDGLQAVTVHSDVTLTGACMATERPGPYFFAPVASLITSASRLMLAMLEKCVHDAGGEYAGCDTDSMLVVSLPERQALTLPATNAQGRPLPSQQITALSWAEVETIRRQFNRLSPYKGVKVEMLKIEDENYENEDPKNGRQRPVWYYGICSKRYCLAVSPLPDSPSKENIPAVKESGLGALASPIDEPLEEKDSKTRALGRKLFYTAMHGADVWSLAESAQPYVVDEHISTVNVWNVWQELNAGKPYAEQMKPHNFFSYAHVMLDPAGLGGLCVPKVQKPGDCIGLAGIQTGTGRLFHIIAPEEACYNMAKEVPAYSLGGYFTRYLEHGERQFLQAANKRPCEPAAARGGIGLLVRRPTRAGGHAYIGKEGYAATPEIDELVPLMNSDRPAYNADHTALRNALHVLADAHVHDLENCRPATARKLFRLAPDKRLDFVLAHGLAGPVWDAAWSTARMYLQDCGGQEPAGDLLAAYVQEEQALKQRFTALLASLPLRRVQWVIGSRDMRLVNAYRAGRLPGLPVLQGWQARIDFERIRDRVGGLAVKDIQRRLRVKKHLAAAIQAGEPLAVGARPTVRALGSRAGICRLEPRHVRELVRIVEEQEAAARADEERTLSDTGRAGLREINAAILSLGGIGPHRDGNLREEYQTLPRHWRRRRGAPPDEFASMLQANYPQLGVHDEAGLYRLGAEYRRQALPAQPAR